MDKRIAKWGAVFFLAIIVWPAAGRAAPVFQQTGSTLSMSNGNVSLQYDLTSGQCAFYWQGLPIIAAFYSGAGLSTGYIKGTNYLSWNWSVVASNEVMVTATGGHPTMKQYFTLDQTNSFLVRLEMEQLAPANAVQSALVPLHIGAPHHQAVPP